MFKFVPTIVAVITALTSSIALAQAVQSPEGIWRMEDGSATARVAKCPTSANWCATVIEEQLKPGEASLLNQMVIRDMSPKGPQSWTGRWYIGDGQSMKVGVKLSRPDMLTLKVCTYVFLCDTIRLNRVSGVPTLP